MQAKTFVDDSLDEVLSLELVDQNDIRTIWTAAAEARASRHQLSRSKLDIGGPVDHSYHRSTSKGCNLIELGKLVDAILKDTNGVDEEALVFDWRRSNGKDVRIQS